GVLSLLKKLPMILKHLHGK
uniref:Antimicrobial peptide Xac-3 n=1 Tax=Xylocopa violacea TaxID=135666 RepID=XAC3_XYLVO|nr:RecName: Full=Antimicrobial peptide Xac-3; Short=Xac3 [Xylocopa violacea]